MNDGLNPQLITVSETAQFSQRYFLGITSSDLKVI